METAERTAPDFSKTDAVITAVENKSVLVKSHMSRLHLSAIHSSTGTRQTTTYAQKIQNVIQSSIMLSN